MSADVTAQFSNGSNTVLKMSKLTFLQLHRLSQGLLFMPIVLSASLLPIRPISAAINGWYGGDPDDVLNTGSVNGWSDQSGNAYGVNVAGGAAYRFGPLINSYGTWGQLIYSQPGDLSGADLSNPSGLTGHMPPNPSPDNGTWVQGHLVNGDCGGDGARAHNLTPISKGINSLHKKYEAVLKRLINCAGASGSSIKFNPNKIPNSRIIYRTHALPPNPGSTVPSGIAVSLGIVINGQMITEAQLNQHFSQAQGSSRWFGDAYYGNGDLKADRQTMIIMLGGVAIGY